MIDRVETRRLLLLDRCDLLVRFHQALDRADNDYDAFDRLGGNDQAGHWYACLVSRLSDWDLRALGELLAALDRLEEGSYGSCAACGAVIDTQWLANHRYSATCSDCAVTMDVGGS